MRERPNMNTHRTVCVHTEGGDAREGAAFDRPSAAPTEAAAPVNLRDTHRPEALGHECPSPLSSERGAGVPVVEKTRRNEAPDAETLGAEGDEGHDELRSEDLAAARPTTCRACGLEVDSCGSFGWLCPDVLEPQRAPVDALCSVSVGPLGAIRHAPRTTHDA